MSSNYRAACCAHSRAEFIAKLGVAVEGSALNSDGFPTVTT